ncbi:dihydroorotate dehydrogenase electron transfer subunit [bacterium 1xD42-62]|uniref:Dihydroorotate dehydrogenase B (NAD(+)), electron transfer subunit n=1 Tax=Parablautia muri TaxID=2320879 RepID=A0A9X5GTI9_9FIRM|nr:dihydroorotate dehydrogenase electron transfer subunit [Parablautia muri]NBJ94254.1 dihydroorotate dehydrogenase electron transfer subunit [Parablautia muri]
MKKKVRARILSQNMLTEGIYDMWLSTELAKEARAGQFIGIYTGHEAHLLPRPISICEVDREKEALRVVYRAVGRGTEIFSAWQPGDEADILGVLGNGYSIETGRGKQVVLMGGGIGIPPMLQLAKDLWAAGTHAEIVLGYRDNQLFLKEEFEKYGKVYAATEDGSVGTKGNVLTAMEAEHLKADVIMACGPLPMLRAVKRYAEEKRIEAYLSLEERMACGVGACLGCVCKTTHKDAHSHVNNARICTDGPVFDAREVEI